jgi:hypothetical protein
MIRHLALLAFFLLPTAHSSAWAADWTRLTQIPGEDQYFYDRSKLVIEGEEATYWKKVLFKKPQAVKNQPAAWSLMRERIHCTQHTLRLISYLYYAADGSTIEYVADHEKEGTPIIPDTLGDAFERHMCELVKARQEANKAEAKKAEAEKAEAEKAAAAKEPQTLPAPATPPAPEPAAIPR